MYFMKYMVTLMPGDEEAKQKVTTVRNIDETLYTRALELAKKMGKPVGEVINEALRMLISTVEYTATMPGYLAKELSERGRTAIESLKEDKKATVISDLEELEVNAKDLEEVEGKVVFRNIKRLIIGGDVTPELFEEKIAGIVMCDELFLPPSIPKLKALRRARLVRRVKTSTIAGTS
jgi:predicted DNA-binding protein